MRAFANTIIAASALATINASYLTYLFIQQKFGNPLDSICDINDTLSCTKVLTSPYATFFGLPVCSIALVVYPTIIILALLAKRSKTPNHFFVAIALLSAMGLTLNTVYLYNEWKFLSVLCVLCAICLVLITTNLVASLWGYAKTAK